MNIVDMNPIVLTAVAVVVIGLVWVVVRWMGRGRKLRRPERPEGLVDVEGLDDRGPPAEGPRLEFYGTPVRLAVLVIAAAGRNRDLPPSDVLPVVIERILPGLSGIIATHQPMICRWPTQLSAQGFCNAFFSRVALPGSRGKGSPWCSVAGRFQIGDRLILVGMLCSAGTPNSLSQVALEHDGQWMDVFRIREE